MMDISSIITKKCKKQELTDDEYDYFTKRIVDGRIDQCQIGKRVSYVLFCGVTYARPYLPIKCNYYLQHLFLGLGFYSVCIIIIGYG